LRHFESSQKTKLLIFRGPSCFIKIKDNAKYNRHHRSVFRGSSKMFTLKKPLTHYKLGYKMVAMKKWSASI